MNSRTGDFRYAAAVLRRERGFTVAALLALALGIGATTAVCSVLYGVLMRPLPFDAPDRLAASPPRGEVGSGRAASPVAPELELRPTSVGTAVSCRPELQLRHS